MKKLLFLIITLFFSVGIVSAEGFVKAEFDVNVTAFNGIDSFSTVTLDMASDEVGLETMITVRIVDRFGMPLSGHQLLFYIDGVFDGVSFVQPSLTDVDGYAYGKIKGTIPGAYVVRVYDQTYSENISIIDSETLYLFPVSTPDIKNEPYYSIGDSNTIHWSAVSGPSSYEYLLQVSTKKNFSTILTTSDWISGTKFQFTNLEGATMYYYRVKARNAENVESDWSNVVFSVQDDKAPVIRVNNPVELVGDSEFGNIKLDFSVTDDLELDEVLVFCKQQSGRLEECGTVQKSGSNYLVYIPISDLEHGFLYALLDNYTFCIEASDVAGNKSDDCSMTIDLTEYTVTPVPVFNNVVNLVLDGMNDAFSYLERLVILLLGGLRSIWLQLLSVLFLVLFTIISITLLIGSFSLMPFGLLRFFYLLVAFFGFRRHGSPVGVVYNSITKKPISFATVYIYDAKNRLLRKDITDKNGIFTADLETGRYRVMVKRSGYLYPSVIIKGKKDVEYQRVYHSESIIVSKRNPMNIYVPLDPLNIVERGEKSLIRRYRYVQLLKSLNVLVAVVGISVAIYTLDKFPTFFNLLIILIYLPIIYLYLRSVVKLNIGMK